MAGVLLACSLPGGAGRATPAEPVLSSALLQHLVLTILLGEFLGQQSWLRPVVEPMPMIPGNGLELKDVELVVIDLDDIVVENINLIFRLFRMVLPQNHMSMIFSRATKVRMLGFVVLAHKFLPDAEELPLLGFGDYLLLRSQGFSLAPGRSA